VTTSARIKIMGTAHGAVSDVTYVVTKPGSSDDATPLPAQGTSRWKLVAVLKPGVNIISVTARGPGGKSDTATIAVFRR
jgi:hypothetical protein